jgi:hypothetical protein
LARHRYILDCGITFLVRHFEHIDLDRDGVISKQELGNCRWELLGGDSHLVTALRCLSAKFHYIAKTKLADDEYGISSIDLRRLLKALRSKGLRD